MVDFSKYQKAASRLEKQETADEIVRAFKEVGFVYLSGHGIPDSTVKNAFAKVCCKCLSVRPIAEFMFIRAQTSSTCPSKRR